MKRSKSSKAWLHEHVNDHYVHQAKAQGYRSRAAFKLQEIDDKDRLLRPGMTVVDLGSAPGSWSQVVVERLQGRGRVYALDILPMEPIPGVHFMQGDFTEDAVAAEFEHALENGRLDLVLSDMAPNISGIASSDQARAIHLCELALEFARAHLQPAGSFLVKVFQGEGFDEFRRQLMDSFATVAVRKPKASRDRSSEVYLLASRLKV